MPTYLVHQNMRVWTPGSVTRRAAYASTPLPAGTPWPANWPAGVAYGFAGVAAPYGVNIAVAGLTEVTKEGNLVALGTVLNPLIGPPGTIYVVRSGTTVGGETTGPIDEYTVIGVRAGFPVIGLGFVSFGGSTQRGMTSLWYETPAPASGTYHPELASADYRGIAFVVVQPPGFGGAALAVGFLHNTYKLTSAIVTPQLVPWAVTKMATIAPYVYVGGDLNVGPFERGRPSLNECSATVAIPPFANTAGGGTTIHGNTLDFWLTNVGPGNVPPGGVVPVPSVSPLTMDGSGPAANSLMSDHAAILLSI